MINEFDTIFIMFCSWVGVVGLTTMAVITSAALLINRVPPSLNVT